MKTKAAILFEINKPLVIEEIEIPKLSAGQTLVKILASGICRGQLNEVRGWKGKDSYLPHLLGHEGTGEVLAIGSGVKKVKPGDYVVASWIAGKGKEIKGAKYKWQNKIINSGPVATFSQYAVISENRLVKISSRIPKEIASLLGCAVPTGAGVIFNTLAVSKNSTIAVFGVGGVGASAILAAGALGLRKIIAIDINSKKLKFAKTLGATDVINFQKSNITESINSISPNGVDFCLEATGVKEAMEKAYGSINNKGTLVIAGNLKAKETISINPFGLICGKKLLGTWGGATDPDRDIPKYGKLYLEGRLKLKRLISRKFRLEEINEALKLLKSNENLGRMVIVF